MPKRGDMIVFRLPRDRRIFYVKRVVGLPGDHVEVRDGQVLVNGQVLEEPYLNVKLRLDQPEHEEELIPPGKYYVLGDNRRDSHDSRRFHAIDGSSIKGKVVLRWWPLEKLDSF